MVGRQYNSRPKYQRTVPSHFIYSPCLRATCSNGYNPVLASSVHLSPSSHQTIWRPTLSTPPTQPDPTTEISSLFYKPSGEILSLDWSSAIPACHPCPLSRVDWRDSISVPPSVLPTWSSLGKQFLFVEDKKGKGGTTGSPLICY